MTDACMVLAMMGLLGMSYEELENPPYPLLPLSPFKIATSSPVSLLPDEVVAVAVADAVAASL